MSDEHNPPATVIILDWIHIQSYQECCELKSPDSPYGYVYAWSVDQQSCWYIGETQDFSIRYNGGYDHLVSGFLELHGQLYIAKITEVKNIENFYGTFQQLFPNKPTPSSKMIRDVVEDDLILINEPLKNDRDSNRRGMLFLGDDPIRKYELRGNVPKFVRFDFKK